MSWIRSSMWPLGSSREQSLVLGTHWLESKPTWWGDITSRGGKGRRRDAIDEKKLVFKWEGIPGFRKSEDTEIKSVLVKFAGRPADHQGLFLNDPAMRRERRPRTGVGSRSGGWGGRGGGLGNWEHPRRKSRACVSSQSLLHWNRPCFLPFA